MRHTPAVLRFTLLSCIALALVGCLSPQGQSTQLPDQRNEDAPVFDCYYANFAWGKIISGRYIDRTGTIWQYKREGQEALWSPEQIAGRYNEADLMAKYLNKEVVGQIDQNELAKQDQRIGLAAQGKLTSQNQSNDAGGAICAGYLFEPKTRSYEEVNLGSIGTENDWQVRNTAPAATDLLQWLRQIQLWGNT